MIWDSTRKSDRGSYLEHNQHRSTMTFHYQQQSRKKVDTMTFWFELVPIRREQPDSFETSHIFDEVCLSRYSRSMEVGIMT